ncbi:hypothetical protein IV203_015597 [Nitzschia inconspicua]|uniref:Uncharacterized protein n=1 Tax=Nitzschia inconspicua TaxID=303405 RepID=A0A9K3PTL8_9STRA|nr:hypothetical protein IV203_015597 [Nitzschia inconspicua]
MRNLGITNTHCRQLSSLTATPVISHYQSVPCHQCHAKRSHEKIEDWKSKDYGVARSESKVIEVDIRIPESRLKELKQEVEDLNVLHSQQARDIADARMKELECILLEKETGRYEWFLSRKYFPFGKGGHNGQ